MGGHKDPGDGIASKAWESNELLMGRGHLSILVHKPSHCLVFDCLQYVKLRGRPRRFSHVYGDVT